MSRNGGDQSDRDIDSVVAWAFGVALLTVGTPAHSHSIFGFQGPGFSGALHLFTSPLALAALLAGVALLHGQPERRIALCGALMGLASIGGGVLAGSTGVAGWGAAGCVATAGLAAAAGLGRQERGGLAWPFALLAGLAVGLATEFDAYSLTAVLGMALAVGFLVGAALSVLAALSRTTMARQRVTLGLRVLGSWAAAIGLLLGALAWRLGSRAGA